MVLENSLYSKVIVIACKFLFHNEIAFKRIGVNYCLYVSVGLDIIYTIIILKKICASSKIFSVYTSIKVFQSLLKICFMYESVYLYRLLDILNRFLKAVKVRNK